MKYYNVALPIKSGKYFTYGVSDEIDIKLGSVVRVPFRNRILKGVVIDEGYEIPNVKMIIEKIIDLPKEIFKLCLWVSKYFLCDAGIVFDSVLPNFSKRIKDVKIYQNKENIEVKFELSDEQKSCYDEIMKNIEGNNVFLIQGVTGSGKTEVYFHIIEQLIKKGKSILYLVPEIGMIPQVLERVRRRFGEGEEYHSRLTRTHQFFIFKNSLDGNIKIVVGARSALFLPIKDLGLIIMDEEHDSSYYQTNQSPFYSGRLVAIKRAEIENIPLILGSATPSVDSYYKALKGEYKLLKITQRIKGMELPDVEIWNLRKRDYLSDELKRRIIEEKGKIIIFLNRRGYAPFVICKNCHYIVKCPKCDIPMTYHLEEDVFICHHCGSTKRIKICEKCNGELDLRSAGTERVEERLKEIFGDSIRRMDRDSMKRREDYKNIYSDLKAGKIKILVGTQMVTKGLDLPDIGLVIVLKADNILNFPDFRATERTFQLLSQVAGRAGRGTMGKVIIQTYHPEHYAIVAAKEHNYEMFFEKEIKYRENAKYPPFVFLGRILFEGKDLKNVQDIAKKYAISLSKKNGINVIGPAICPIKKKNKFYRYHILLKSEVEGRIQEAISELTELKSNVKIRIEIEPYDLM
uniref:Replication restart protein PriA n=1 Tax=candidate division WOR-3 bacterium TaxID=2052148 RepID=A0A7C4Y5H9_UNCW3